MRLSVIIIGYNSWHYLERNLASLSFLKDVPELEVIFVDNASTDNTISNIEVLYPFVRLIKNSQNKGVSAARNQGMQVAEGEYIWILDSDTEVNQDALMQMLSFMDEHPDVGLCGCKMYGQDGRAQVSCRKYPTIRAKMKAGMHIVGKKMGLNLFPNVYTENSYNMEQAEPFDVDYLIGACQMIRRQVQQQVGFLDEKIFYGPEDADFCLRIRRAGYRICYLPGVSIYHAYQRATTHKVFSRLTFRHAAGLLYYFRKHKKSSSLSE